MLNHPIEKIIIYLMSGKELAVKPVKGEDITWHKASYSNALYNETKTFEIELTNGRTGIINMKHVSGIEFVMTSAWVEE